MNTSTFALSSSSSSSVSRNLRSTTSTSTYHHHHHRNLIQQQQQQQSRRKFRSINNNKQQPQHSNNNNQNNNQNDKMSTKTITNNDEQEQMQIMTSNTSKIGRTLSSSSLYSNTSSMIIDNNNHNNHQKIRFKTNPIQYLSFCIVDLVHKAFEKDEKVDEFEQMIQEICGGQEFIYRRQQEIDVLCEKTSFSKKEIKLLYWGWKLSCPEGILNESIFYEIYSQFFPQAGDSSIYARYVYQAMFADEIARNEPITFAEYARALSTLCRGTLMDKIKWIFTLYDINHDGRITFDEVYKISVAIYALLGFHVTPMHNTRTYEEHARRVFNKLDQNSTGYVTFEEFKDICLKNETILTSMQQLDTHAI